LKKKCLRIKGDSQTNKFWSSAVPFIFYFVPLHFWNTWLKIKISRGDKSVPRDLQQLGSLLKRERERAGMTVRQLADAAGLVPSTVSRLETGFIATPRPEHLQRLAHALGIDVEELYVAAGYLNEGALPELKPYLRAKYGLTRILRASLVDHGSGAFDVGWC
jgi:transcriptional regulator with XRE-family HTH domain